jgi:uncharacterized RDD family membrane protein YckC
MNEITTVVIDEAMMVPWYKRLLNLIIDICVVYFVFMLLGLFAGVLAAFGSEGFLNWFTEMDGLTDRLVTTLVMVIYLFAMEVTTQRSVGKFITGTIVVSEDGTKPEPRKIMVRALCRIIGLEALTFIREKPRGWHDSAADTYVVDVKKYREALNVKNSFDEIGIDIEQA